MTMAASCAEEILAPAAVGGKVAVRAPMIHMNMAMIPPPQTNIVRRPKRSVKTAMAMSVAKNRTMPYTPVANS
jgi:hypothetical protein